MLSNFQTWDKDFKYDIWLVVESVTNENDKRIDLNLNDDKPFA